MTMILMATGHREPYPGFSEDDEKIVHLKAKLSEELLRLKHKILYAITGAAQGWDTWFGEVLIAMEIPFWCFEPFAKHGAGWDDDSKVRHNRLLRHGQIKYINQEYNKQCFLQRDRAMVADSTHVMALLNPECTRGGTLYTVRDAKKKGIPVYNMWQHMK